MACNGWNHGWNCDCDFRGSHGYSRGGYVGARPISGYFIHDGNSVVSEKLPYESFTVPNASCPICNCLVFYYQSENDGRVFFDELDPPWPKHSCTDNAEIQRNYLHHIAPNHRSSGVASWQKAGWKPVYRFKYKRQSDILLLHVRKSAGTVSIPIGLFPSADNPRPPLLIRKVRSLPGVLSVSYLVNKDGRIQGVEHRGVFNALSRADLKRFVKTKKGSAVDQNEFAIHISFELLNKKDRSPDWSAADHWFTKAAKAGLAEAKWNLLAISSYVSRTEADSARLRNSIRELRQQRRKTLDAQQLGSANPI